MAKGLYGVQTLLASAAQTTTSTGTAAVDLFQFCGGDHAHINAIAFVLDVTNAATDAGDTLDVFVQTLIDGTNWVDVVHFTQVVGNGADDLTYIAKIERGTALSEFEIGTTLTATNARDIFGEQWRVRFAITDSGTDNATFTFGVYAVPM